MHDDKNDERMGDGDVETPGSPEGAGNAKTRDVEAIIFQTLPLPPTKTKKRPLTIFFNFCGSVPCLLLHFIILRKQKPSFIAITLPTSHELIVSNYSVFLFLRY